MHNKRRQLSFVLMAVAAAAISIGVLSRGGGGNAQAADPGTATFSVTAPGTAQALNTPFNVVINLAQFTPSVASPDWGGYDNELYYDDTVLEVVGGLNGITRGLCNSSALWAAVAYDPTAYTTCFAQASTSTGTLDTISFQCIADGTSVLEEVPRNGSDASYNGSALYDENGADFAMTLIDGQVACGTGVLNTPTVAATATTTNTPLATNTATNTPTATNTVIPATATEKAAQTQTAQANFGGASTSTPLPGTQTAIAALTPSATEAPGETATSEAPPPPPPPPGGGTTNPGGAPGGVITLPNTGSAGGGVSGQSLWLIVAGIVLATFGTGLFVKSLRVR